MGADVRQPWMPSRCTRDTDAGGCSTAFSIRSATRRRSGSTISRPTGVELYVKAEFFNPAGSVKDRLALSIIEDGRAERRAEARPDGGRGDQRQYRHRARHGLRREGLSAGGDDGRQLLGRAAQADADAGRQGGADAAGREGLRHVSQGGGAGRGERLVPRPPVRDRGQRRASTRTPPRARSSPISRASGWTTVVTGYGTGGTVTGVAPRAAPRAPGHEDRPDRARQRAASRQRHRAGARRRRLARRKPSRLRAAPDPGLDAGLHSRTSCRRRWIDRLYDELIPVAGAERHRLGAEAGAAGGHPHRHLRRRDLRRRDARSRNGPSPAA